MKRSSIGWLAFSEDDVSDVHKAVQRLRKDLKPGGVEVAKLIENNGYKQYRISVPPDQITLNRKTILRNVDGSDKFLSELPQEERSRQKAKSA